MSELESWLSARGVSRVIIDRVIRLNPNPEPGVRLRGWHRKTPRQLWDRVVPKGEIIRRHGRVAWLAFASQNLSWRHLIKDGKRCYAAGEAYQDFFGRSEY